MKRSNLITATLLTGLFTTGAALANDRLKHNEIYQLRQSGEIMSMEKVLEQASSLQPGQLVEAELDRDNGKYVYELKIIDADGKMHDLELDARTGELLKRELEN